MRSHFSVQNNPVGIPETQGEQFEESNYKDDFAKALDEFGKKGVIEVIGQFGSNCREGCVYKTAMLGGGRLTFLAGPSTEKHFEEMLAADTTNFQEMLKASKDKDNQQHPVRKRQFSQWLASTGNRRLYYIEVDID